MNPLRNYIDIVEANTFKLSKSEKEIIKTYPPEQQFIIYNFLKKGETLEYILTHRIIIFKAGTIPFRYNNEVEMLFIIPSDPEFGGDRPNIIKGGADLNETPMQTALRETLEETGIQQTDLSNIKQAYKGMLGGNKAKYDFYVFTGEVTKQLNLKPTYEVKSFHWMTMKEYQQYGRKSHLSIVKQVHSFIMNNY